jgi:alpha-amylase/alpha-mannosidase (GH57 family)
MERYLCIHCHFYQPPRENPWLEAVEIQDSAYPYHDWNERITAECYAPNSAARILDGEGHIVKIVNNYSRISFNFGPTLLSWMEDNAPHTYAKVLQADKESQELFSGHGSALAQAYNHMILPLATRRDKYTQVLWGIRDFERRFGRFPEGMWLPETAVDLETLEVLAELGVRFTILAPHQARQVRKLTSQRWRNVEGANIDPTRAYVANLPSGRNISVFFYDGPISRAVAFEHLLSNGEHFAQRLVSGFSDSRRWPQLMHIATDGETYGHHHPHGDMALAYALDYIESKGLARITNYGEYLAKHPARHEVEIIRNTSWSCVHGIERWRNDCGCNSGMKPGWTQHWRAPLRQALDWLRDELAGPYEQKAQEYLKDPWAARDDYIQVVLDRSPAARSEFLARQQSRELTDEEQIAAWKLLEIERHAMLMYTSCGWFFDELSGIETVQVIMYAGRALQIAQDVLQRNLESGFLERLAQAHSNVASFGDGARIYTHWVKPAILDLPKVAAHFAVSSLFDHHEEHPSIYCYDVSVNDAQRLQSGRFRMDVGHARICSRITQECGAFTYGVLHLGDHNINAGVRTFRGEPAYREAVQELSQAFNRADVAETLRLLDRHFHGAQYTLRSLFRDEQRRVMGHILNSRLAEVEAHYRQIYESDAPLLRFMSELHMPRPKVLQVTAEFVLNSSLRHAFEAEELDLGAIAALMDAAARDEVTLDTAGLSYVLKRRLATLADLLAADPAAPAIFAQFEAAVRLARSLPFEVDLWHAQNLCYRVLQEVRQRARNELDAHTEEWLQRWLAIAEKLNLRYTPAAASLTPPPPEPVPEAA